MFTTKVKCLFDSYICSKSVYSKEYVIIRNPLSYKELKRINTMHGVITAFVQSPNKNLICTGGTDHKVRVWDLDAIIKNINDEPKCVYEFSMHTTEITSIDLHDNKYVCSSSHESIYMWNLETHEIIHEIKDVNGNYKNVKLQVKNVIDQNTKKWIELKHIVYTSSNKLLIINNITENKIITIKFERDIIYTLLNKDQLSPIVSVLFSDHHIKFYTIHGDEHYPHLNKITFPVKSYDWSATELCGCDKNMIYSLNVLTGKLTKKEWIPSNSLFYFYWTAESSSTSDKTNAVTFYSLLSQPKTLDETEVEPRIIWTCDKYIGIIRDLISQLS